MSSDELLNQDLQKERQILNKNDKASEAKQQSDKSESFSNLTEELNAVYAEEDSSLDPFFVSLQALSLPKETW
jgi:ATP-dependent helicase/DNAse subunit B